jgi:hypothetical protein
VLCWGRAGLSIRLCRGIKAMAAQRESVSPFAHRCDLGHRRPKLTRTGDSSARLESERHLRD